MFQGDEKLLCGEIGFRKKIPWGELSWISKNVSKQDDKCEALVVKSEDISVISVAEV